jgi:uncharacterized protein YjbI with pentapeptide repeats
MADEKLLEILRQGVEVWNKWREDNPDVNPLDLNDAQLRFMNLTGIDLHEVGLIKADLCRVNLREANLSRAILSEADLREANLEKANLREIYLDDADLSRANLSNADLDHAELHGINLNEAILNGVNLCETDLRGAKLYAAKLIKADIRGASLDGAELDMADLRGADLRGTNLRGANLRSAKLIGADLRGADLREAVLVRTDLSNANLSDCKIFGISAWKLNLEGTIQSNLIISDRKEPIITVDNLEIAQFIHLLLHNEKLRDVIDTIGKKAVLILGRFSPERKAVLEAIRQELRNRNYVPILFDFEKPNNRDLTETVTLLAGMARFVIADLSDPHSIPHELMSFGEKLLSVPIQAIFCPVPEHKWEYPMFEHLARYPHVLPIHRYDNQEQLIAVLNEKVIAHAEAKVEEMKPKRLW